MNSRSSLPYQTLRIYLTFGCNQRCPHCLNRFESRPDHFIDFSRLKQVLRLLGRLRYPQVNLMGGEPLLHPQFSEIYQFAQAQLPAIKLFTNGTLAFPSRLKPRREDDIIYNFYFAQHSAFGRHLEQSLQLFRKVRFHLVLNSDRSLPQLKKQILNLAKQLSGRNVDKKSYTFLLSFDCTHDLMQDQSELNENMAGLLVFLGQRGFHFKLDHPVPLCFLQGRLKTLASRKGLFSRHWCSLPSAGMLDPDFNLSYCAVYQKKVGNLFKSDGRLISPRQLHQFFQQAYQEKIKTRQPDCRSCRHWLKECNGACFPYTRPRPVK